MKIFPIPIFSDNYVWTLTEGSEAAVVDPGDAAPVLQALEQRGLRLSVIVITHWHADHIGGLPALLEQRHVPVYGPRGESAKIPGLTRQLIEGDSVSVLGRTFSVMEVPGHTLGHIAYYGSCDPAARTAGSDDILLCGDTLFSGGCGRLFEGTPAQMHASLARLAALPDDTKVYCTHEYTASNLAFALAAEPGNADARAHAQRVHALRLLGRPSLPTSIGLEKRINPFLRCAQRSVRDSAERHSGAALADEVQVFAAIRRWKDGFKAA